jgi:hypothetical protein
LDNYYSIYKKKYLDNTTLSEAIHMTTYLSKKVKNCNQIPIIYNEISVYNPINVDWILICKNLINIYQKLLDMFYTTRKNKWIKEKNNILLTFNLIN